MSPSRVLMLVIAEQKAVEDENNCSFSGCCGECGRSFLAESMDAEFLELNQKLLLLSVMKHPDGAPAPVSGTRTCGHGCF